jgi:hypothetical protein
VKEETKLNEVKVNEEDDISSEEDLLTAASKAQDAKFKLLAEDLDFNFDEPNKKKGKKGKVNNQN